MIYFGTVEDRLDPKKMGRVKVRIMGVHSPNLSEVPTDSLPWATVMTPTTSPSTSGVGHTPYLVSGSWVVVVFNDKNLQDPIVIGSIPGYPEERRSRNVGFADPSGQFPRWTNDSDLSYSARQNKFRSSAHYTQKNDERLEDISVAAPPRVTTVAADQADEYYNPTPWSEVEASNNHIPTYPMNHVYESESGHVIEVDDTPGARRRHTYHPSGTYEEIYDDGTRSIKIVGKDYEMILNGKNMYVNGDLNVTCTGNMRHLVEGNYHLEVQKDFTLAVQGSMQQKVGGNWEGEIIKDRSFTIGNNDNLTVHIDQVETIVGNKTVSVQKDWENTITQNYDVTSFANITQFSKSGTSATTLGGYNVTSQNNIKIESPSSLNLTIKTDVTESIGGNQTTTVTGNIDINATRIDLN